MYTNPDNNNAADILNNLENGIVNVTQAAERIRLLNSDLFYRARKIKITIVSKHRKYISIPAIPINLISSFASLGFKLMKWSKQDENANEHILNALSQLNSHEIKRMINCLRNYGGLTLIEIEDSVNNTAVKIDLL